MSQVTYGILRIYRVGFLRISERRSADVREPSAESSLDICGIIAEYSRNSRRAPSECSAEGLRRTFEGDLASRSQRIMESHSTWGWLLPRIRAGVRIVVVTVMMFKNMHVPRTQHRCRQSADSLQTIRRDAEYIPLISAQVFTESSDGLPRNASDFRK